MNERLLVPVDDSDPAWQAIDDAVTLFDPREIVLLHVLELDAMTHSASSSAAADLEATREQEAEKLFDEIRDRLDATDISVETIFETGDPSSVIVELAALDEIDHVVMGSHGRSGLSEMLVGSVAKNVIEESPVSLTVARP